MISKATTPEEYVAALPEDRVAIIEAIRNVMIQHLPMGFVETMSYGMLGYVVPHSIYPQGYHCDRKQALPFISVASQKNHISIYHMGLIDEGELLAWFKAQWPQYSTKKLDIGKSCIRFKKAEDVPLALIADLAAQMTPQDWIEKYEKIIRTAR